MAKQKLILPQTKTFIFPKFEIKPSEIDDKINKWKKETVLNGDHPAPTAPSISATDESIIIICSYATQIEK